MTNRLSAMSNHFRYIPAYSVQCWSFSRVGRHINHTFTHIVLMIGNLFIVSSFIAHFILHTFGAFVLYIHRHTIEANHDASKFYVDKCILRYSQKRYERQDGDAQIEIPNSIMTRLFLCIVLRGFVL